MVTRAPILILVIAVGAGCAARGWTPERVLATYGLQIVRVADAVLTQTDGLFEAKRLTGDEAAAIATAVKEIALKGEQLEGLLRILSTARGDERTSTTQQIASLITEVLDQIRHIPLRVSQEEARTQLATSLDAVGALAVVVLGALDPIQPPEEAP